MKYIELLEEAKKRYKPGCHIKSAFSDYGAECYCSGVGEFQECIDGYKNIIWCLDKKGEKEGWLYHNGIWAEIIKESLIKEINYEIF